GREDPRRIPRLGGAGDRTTGPLQGGSARPGALGHRASWIGRRDASRRGAGGGPPHLRPVLPSGRGRSGHRIPGCEGGVEMNGRIGGIGTRGIFLAFMSGAIPLAFAGPAAAAAAEADATPAEPAYLSDRGRGLPTSLFGTYVQKGEWLVYPF